MWYLSAMVVSMMFHVEHGCSCRLFEGISVYIESFE